MGRRRWAAGWVLGPAAVILLAGCPAAKPGGPTSPTPGGTGAAVEFAPGAPGLGDPYYPKAGNGGYDVGHYALDVRYDPDTDQLTGHAVITATATSNLASFNLDLHGLTVDDVTLDGGVVKYTRDGDELTIATGSGLPKGKEFTVDVRYHGVPELYGGAVPGGVFAARKGKQADDGAVAIGEPFVAASWFPVNDHPRDKATYQIRITVPGDLAALSNGVLEGKQPAGSGDTTWAWSESSPMASYLATMVIGDYRVRESTHKGKAVVVAVDADLPQQVDSQLARTPEVVDFLETQFGPYPFAAMGGIAIDDPRIRYALENQSRPIYSSTFFGGADASWVIAHELAHQWFGDSVSVNDWKEVWLNEGFATYAEWLWSQHWGGQTPQQTFDRLYAQAGNAMWRTPPGDPGADDPFVNSVYDRGAMTLHALRMTVGDSAFFEIIKTWAAEKRNANATTPEFVALAERISGQQLDALFLAWLYGETRPPRPSR